MAEEDGDQADGAAEALAAEVVVAADGAASVAAAEMLVVVVLAGVGSD